MSKWPAVVPAIIAVSVLTLAVATWTSMAQGGFCWQATLGAAVFWGLLIWFGACGLALLHERHQRVDAILATLVGFYCLSVVLFVGTVILRFDLRLSLAMFILVGGGLNYRALHRRPLLRLQCGAMSTSALVIAIALTTLWSRQSLSPLEVTDTTVTSLPWYDTFYHSVHIGHFAHGSGKVLGGDPLLQASPLAPYHYGAYMVPSLFVRCTGISARVATVAMFTSLGTLLTGLAAYGFGQVLFGPVAGLLAVVICLGLPDPTFYLLENRWLSYFFFQQIASNGAMGTALMLLAWTFCLAGSREQLRRYTMVGLCAGLAVVCFKSQIFLTYSFGLLLFAAVTFPRLALPARCSLGFLAAGSFVVAVTKVLPAIPRAPTLALGTTAGSANLHWSLSKIGGACQQCIVDLAKDYALFLPIGALAFLCLAFGVVVPLCLVLAGSTRVRRAFGRSGMWFLWTASINYLVVTLGLELNANHGDPYEIIHKTFVWPYLACAVWCGCALAAWLRSLHETTRRVAMTIGLPFVVSWLGWTVHSAGEKLQTRFVYPGWETAVNCAIERGAFDAARFIRRHSREESVVQPGKLDSHLMLLALSERRAQVVYPPGGHGSPPLTQLAHQQLAAMLAAPSEQELHELARSNHVDYLILYPGQQPAWAASLKPEFQSGEYRVYRL